MKKLFAIITFLAATIGAGAQEAEGTSYYLPRTAINYRILIEKTSVTPGDLYMYSERFLKKSDVASAPSTTYRIINIKINAVGIPDTSKVHYARMDTKHSINSLDINEEGILLAVNTKGKAAEEVVPFKPAAKPEPLNPRDYLNQDILAAGSTAKMAELTAQEIYDIRDSKSQLNKGQADFMPKDGEQLRIMLKNLNTQENALVQLFEGVTEKDTSEVVITFIPTREVSKHVMFRFSKKLGLVDRDDLAGEPYYISVEDLHKMVSNSATVEETKKSKDDAGIYANLPGKIKVELHKGTQLLSSNELYASQFGKTLPLDNELFGRKLFTEIIYNPITGNIETIKTEMVKK